MKQSDRFRGEVGKWCRFAPLILGVLLLAGCSDSTPADQAPLRDAYFSIRIDDQELWLQLALSEGEMARGLMFRERLEPGHGMLFLYPEARRMSFWMRNTPLPLDIAFIDGSGTIREVHPLYPFDETPVRSASDQMVGAIELGRGEMDRLGLGIGSVIDRDDLVGAILSRGRTTGNYVFP